MQQKLMVRIIFSEDFWDNKEVREKIKNYITQSYKDITFHTDKIIISNIGVIFQKGQFNIINFLKTPKISKKTRIETYVTTFEGIKVGNLFKNIFFFEPIGCELTLLGAMQYRILNNPLEKEFKIDIGKICGEESVRFIRISSFSYKISII